MENTQGLKLLFLINPTAGKNKIDWQEEISKYFASKPYQIELYLLPKDCNSDQIREKIRSVKPAKVVAVGGDGTVKAIAAVIYDSDLPLCILPAGSANGLAKELKIPLNPAAAMEVIENGESLKIHMLKINDELCIHLSDIGFNAFVVKKFEAFDKRGMWGYIIASWKVLWGHSKMTARIQTDNEYVQREAAMIVVANATRYGSGAVINPEGQLDDNVFEVIVVKRIALSELFKMMISHKPYNPEKTEVFQTRSLQIKSKHKVHFQVDGEYLGKVNNIQASVMPNALKVIIPPEK